MSEWSAPTTKTKSGEPASTAPMSVPSLSGRTTPGSTKVRRETALVGRGAAGVIAHVDGAAAGQGDAGRGGAAVVVQHPEDGVDLLPELPTWSVTLPKPELPVPSPMRLKPLLAKPAPKTSGELPETPLPAMMVFMTEIAPVLS